MIGLEIFHEPLGPITPEQHEWNEYQRRAEANRRPHCGKCGRFVPSSTVKTVGNYWGDDWETTGTCATHGRVYVSWERA